MTEVLGEAVLDLTADLGDLAAKLAEARAMTQTALGDMGTRAQTLDTQMATVGRNVQTSFADPLLNAFAKADTGAITLAEALKQAEDASGSLKDQIALLPAAMQDSVKQFHDLAVAGEQMKMVFDDMGSSWGKTTAEIVTGTELQKQIVDDLTGSYERLAVAKRLASGDVAGGILGVRPATGPGGSALLGPGGQQSSEVFVRQIVQGLDAYSAKQSPYQPSPYRNLAAASRDTSFARDLQAAASQLRDAAGAEQRAALAQELAASRMDARDKADLAALNALASKPTDYSSWRGGAPFSDAALAALGGGAAGRGGGGGGGGTNWGSILTALAWGRGGGGGGIGIPWTGMRIPGAGLGSLGAMAGLGPEHVVMTGLGVGGTLAQAGIGAGLLGLGAAGQFAVGGGSDIAVAKSTIADTETLAKDYSALSKAVDIYGKSSSQAAVAQAQLNMDIKNLSAGTAGQGVKAEQELAKNADALDTRFDALSQNARVQVANIGEQMLKVGNTYLPLMTTAATKNLSLINTSLRPLFEWLNGPQGIAIFEHLEANFEKNIPKSVDAFTNAIEGLLKLTSQASDFTGGFITSLDNLAKKFNAFAGTPRAEAFISNMVDKFRMWAQFVKDLGLDIDLLFKQDVGTGAMVVTQLDNLLQRIGAYEKSTRGAAQIHSLFEVHFAEVKQLIDLLPHLVGPVTELYMHAAPTLTTALTDIVIAISAVLGEFEKLGGPVASMIVAIGILGSRLGILMPVLRGVGTALGIVGGKTSETAALTLALEANTKALQAQAAAAAESAGAMGELGAAEVTTTGETAAETGALGRFGLTGMGSSLAGKISGAPVVGGLVGEGEGALVSEGTLAAGMSGALAGGAGILAGSMVQNAAGLRGGTLGTLGGGVAGAGIGAALGSVVPGIGTMLGAGIGGALGSSLGPTVAHTFETIFGGKKAEDYGKQWGQSFSKGMGPGFQAALDQQIGPKATQLIQDNINKTSDAIGHATQTLREDQANLKSPWAAFADPKEKAALEAQMTKDANDLAGLQYRKGSQIGQELVAGMQNVKYPTTGGLYQSIVDAFTAPHMTNTMREAALTHVLAYVHGLEANKELPKNAVDTILKLLEQEFPGLTAVIQKAGMDSDSTLANSMKLTQTRSQLQATLSQIQQDWGIWSDNPAVSGQDWLNNINKYATDMEVKIATTTGNAHTKAVQNFQLMQTQVASLMGAMDSNTVQHINNMVSAIEGGSTKAANNASSAFGTMVDNINSAEASGALTAQQANALIVDATNAVLKLFKIAPLPTPLIKQLNTKDLQLMISTPQGRSAAANWGGSTASGTGTSYAGGGLFQVGRPGQAGLDAIPMNVGGTNIMVGAGEQVAVFNRHQAPIMNRALMNEGYAGLGGFFATEKKPNYMAQGGFVPGYDDQSGPMGKVRLRSGVPGTGAGWAYPHPGGGPATRPYAAGGYIYPIPGFTLGRTDMGVDANAAPGTPIGALGDSKLTGVIPSWFKGQPLLTFQLLDGPDAGKYWYVAEQIIPVTEAIGTTFKAGQAVARYAGSGTGIEIGWAGSASGSTLAQSTSGYTEGEVTAAGTNFRAFIMGLAQGKITAGPGGPGMGGPSAVPQIQAPTVTGDSALADITRSALGMEANAANQWLAQQALGGAGYPGGLPAAGGGNAAANERLAQSMLAAFGWGPDQMAPLISLWTKESGWSQTAKNPSSGAYGIPQSLPANKMASAGPDWLTNPATQIKWGLGYIKSTYGSPAGAWAHEMANNWYDLGGLVEGGHYARGTGSSRPLRKRPRPGLSTRTTGKHGPPGAPGPKGKGAGKIPGAKKGKKPTVLPYVAALYQQDPKLGALITQLTQIDTDLGELGNWQSYIQSLHGTPPVTPIITAADGTETINWGDEVAALEELTGLPDPITGDTTKSIYDALREIGYTGTPINTQNVPYNLMGTPFMVNTRGGDETEYGLDDIFIGAYQQQMSTGAAALKEFWPWWTQILKDRGKWATKLDHLKARIEYLTQRKERIAKTKSDRDNTITNEYVRLKANVKAQLATKTFSSQRFLTDGTAVLMKDREDQLAALPASMPADIINATQKAAWKQAYGEERKSIYDNYTTQLTDLRNWTATQRLDNSLSNIQATAALTIAENNAKQAVTDQSDTLSTNLTDEIRKLNADKSSANTNYNSDNKAITDVSTPPGGSWMDKLQAYTDPMGATATDLATYQNVNLVQLKETVDGLLGTSTAAASATTATDSALLALVEQQNTMLTQQLLIANMSQSVLSNISSLLPPFGGSLNPPFGGAFAQGGVVPGPLGEPRTVIAHGGERITPPGQNQMHVQISDQRVRVWHNDVEQIVHETNNTAARHARRRLPGNGGGMLGAAGGSLG